MNSKILLGFFAVLALPASAAISFTGGTYSENFDSLGGSPWINDTTLPGWYAYISNPAGGTMLSGLPDNHWGPVSSYAGALYENLIYSQYGRSIGQVSTSLLNLATSDGALLRSLGSYGTGGHDVVFGVALRNDTGTNISAVLLSFFGEQWRVNALASDPSMKLDFSYGVFPSFNSALASPNTLAPHAFNNGYTDPAGGALDFAALKFGFTNTILDGTAASNRQLMSGTLPVVWGPGDYLVLRWFDDDSASSTDAMLAINDLHVTAIPEPSVGILLLGTAAMLLRRTRREEKPQALQKRLPGGRAGFLACALPGFGNDLFQRRAKGIRPVDPKRQRGNPVASLGSVEGGAVEVACCRQSVHGDPGGKSPLLEDVRHFRNHLVRFLAGHTAVSQTLPRG